MYMWTPKESSSASKQVSMLDLLGKASDSTPRALCSDLVKSKRKLAIKRLFSNRSKQLY